MSIPKIDEDILASSLRRQQIQLQEMIDAIERRDIGLEQVKEKLGWIASNLSHIRRNVPLHN
jgi:hypothetical protein